MCDDAWHIFCLRPVLHFVPDGDWFCPKCHHQMLIQKLSYAFIEHQQLLKAKEEEERKRALEIERLNRERKHNGIDLKNIIFNQVCLYTRNFSGFLKSIKTTQFYIKVKFQKRMNFTK